MDDVVAGEDGIGGDPVEVGTLEGAGGPFVGAPVAGAAGGGVGFSVVVGGPSGGGVALVVEPGGEVEDAGAGAGEGGGGGGEFAFVRVVDLDRLAEHGDAFGGGSPVVGFGGE